MGKYNSILNYSKINRQSRAKSVNFESDGMSVQQENVSGNNNFRYQNTEQNQNDSQKASRLSGTCLQFKGNQKRSRSTTEFQNNKVNTCSYVKKIGATEYIAIPFYERPMSSYQSSYCKEAQVQKKETQKLVSTTQDNFNYKARQPLTVSSQNKPLGPYDPNSRRSKMGIDDFKSYYVNRSVLEIGQRNQRDIKHYITTNNNEYGRKTAAFHHVNPAIRAFRFQWDHRYKNQ